MNRSLIWIVSILMLASSCSVDRPEGTFPAQDTGLVTDITSDVEQQEVGAGSAASVLDGNWAMIFQVSTCVAVLSAVIENLAWARYQLRFTVTAIDQANARVWVKATGYLCSYVLTPIIMDLSAIVPQQLIDSLPEVEMTCLVEYPKGTDLSGELPDLTGAAMSCDPLVQLWGLDLEDPLNDPIPSSADDPTVIDQDGDGNPGMTLVLGETGLCEMYIVQRATYLFSGTFDSSISYQGAPDSTLKQNILAGTEALCESENETTPNPKRNRLYLVRDDGFGGAFDLDDDANGFVTCGEMTKQLDEVQSHYGVVKDDPDTEHCDKE